MMYIYIYDVYIYDVYIYIHTEIKSFSFSVVKASCCSVAAGGVELGLEDGFYVHVTLPPNETDSQDKGRLGMSGQSLPWTL